MKLDRISRIRGHRIFDHFVWPTDLAPFGRFNLIYGWNGSGKTTLSNILRALQLKTTALDGEVTYELDGNAIRGAQLADAALPEVRVFNRDSVSRSVFETPGSAHLPPVFVFGEDSVELQRQIEALKSQLDTLREASNASDAAANECEKKIGTFESNKAREIKNLLLAPGGAYNNYNAGDYRNFVTAAQEAGGVSLLDEERSRLVELKGAVAKDALSLAQVPFPDLLALRSEVQELLKQTVTASVVQDLLDAPTAANWVKHGLEMHTKDGDASTCKFCRQPLQASRLRELEAHFNDRFKEFERQVHAIKERIEEAALQLERVSFPSASQLYTDLQADYARELVLLKGNLSSVVQGLQSLARCVQVKTTRMFESLTLNDLLLGGGGMSPEEPSLLKALLAVMIAGGPSLSEFMGKTTYAKLQAIIKKHNDRSAAFDQEVRDARRRLHDHEIAASMSEWRLLFAERDAAVSLRANTAKALADAQDKIGALEADILQHRPAAEMLNADLVAYLGHDEIQVVAEKTGYRLMRRGEPATNLSEGERTAIAFLHFLRSLSDRTFDLATGIVVIDDPITSLDSNSTYSAFGFLKEKLKEVNQLFVFTHNFTFFRQVRNWFQFLNRGVSRRALPAHFYMLRARMDGGQRRSHIESLDPFLRDYESEYHYLFKRVHEASTLPAGQPLGVYYDLPNLARRLLETFLVFKVPDKNSLHSRLQEVDFAEPRKTRLLRFVDTHSHAEQVSEGHDEASALAEAPTILRDLLDLIEQVDSDHHTRMVVAMAL
ncbi:MAG: hypothetical protein EKK47_18115 [Burkholderiales bacterium]|nr:MAG: hypothetical protein EKK47_18115 [Burkholderiales bacterium]